jgi:hypothetical protein
LITETASAVSQQNDKGGVQHIVQATGSAQPATDIRQLNGRNVLDYDGDDSLAKTSFPLPSNGTAAFFMVAVIDAIDTTFDAIFSVNADSRFQVPSGNATQFNGQILSTGMGMASPSNFSGGPFPGPSIYNVNLDGVANTCTAMVDGTTRLNIGYTGAFSTSQTLRVFGNRTGDQFPDGAVAEFLIVGRVDAGLRLLIEGYLAYKWGLRDKLPTDHPYKYHPPTW